MEALVWVLIVATILVAAGELRLLHQIRKLPNKLYGVCLRIACVLALATFAINIAICFARDYGQLYAISLITSLPQAQSFLLAQLEMLRMLLPAYGVASPHIVTALQIGTSAVTTLALAAVIVSVFRTEWSPTIWIGTDMWIVTIGIYDVLQQLLMLHYVLVHLKNAPVWLRPWFGGLLAVNFLIIGAGPSVDLLLRDTHIAWNGIAYLLACTFILVSAEATQLFRSVIKGLQHLSPKMDNFSDSASRAIIKPFRKHKATTSIHAKIAMDVDASPL
ncbi:hypothetical protein HK105_200420 [Polyrhizophydium stewartii]|uniref:Uncharacterized protein n=1 Tax=Polyrhizophydium stewartii TaxID=2732419 RepID=A0ABR4NLD8_9FUNG